ncbi:chromosome segregation protein SMC [Thalassotalea sp. PLHSN55]|uniref:chromosome segregation protein SMC n=1 Tax=Thalassotalea sp. PLHSN55 TaxID=3435888 RepID=UPI003F83190C
MRLKHIKLAGFKSFVDPTKVPFEQQMTAIVGPNGCGKSNIIDAVRWVLGESSAKNLRGDAMTDVIFNGAESRKPIGQASVELVFDNSEGRLKGNMADRSEVSIRRLVNRESQNTYFLNGSKCRRRDITDIFLGTGLGPRSYAIIEQGTISRLIESKPQELRVFIEEAAGISKYKERRRETENRIVHTRENLERLADIQAELTLRIDTLHQQAEAAKRYRTLKSQERTYKAELNVLRWQQFDLKKQTSLDKITKIQADVEQLVVCQGQNENALFIAKQKLAVGTEDMGELQSEKLSLTNNIARAEQNLKHIQLQQGQLQKEYDAAKQYLIEDQKRLAEFQQQTLDKKASLEVLTPELTSCQQNLTNAQQSLDENNQKLYVWQQSREQYYTQMQKLNHQRITLSGQVSAQSATVEQLEQKQTSLEKTIASLMEKIAEQDKSATSNEKIHEFANKLDEDKSVLAQQLHSADEISEQLNENKQQLAELQGLEQAQQANLDSLVNQQNKRSDWQISQQRWLAENGQTSEQLLFDQLNVASGWQTAVELVLSDWLQAQAVEQFPTKLDIEPVLLISQYSQSKQQSASMALESMNESTLASKVSGNGSFQAWLSNIFVATDFEQAKKLLSSLNDEQSVICQDGTWLGHHFLKKGQINDANEQLTRVNHIRDLESELIKSKQNIRAFQTKISQLTETRKSVLSNIENSQADIALLEKKLNQWQQERALFKQEQQHLSLQLDSLTTEKQLIEQQLPEQQKKLTMFKEQLAQLPQVDESNNQQAELEQQQLQQAIKHDQQSVNQLNQQMQQVAVQIERVNNQLTHIAQSEKHLQEQVRLSQQQQQQRESSLSQNSDPLSENESQLQTWLAQMLAVEEKLALIQNNQAQAHQEVSDLEQEKVRTNGQITQLKEQLTKHHLDAESFRVRAQALLEQLEELQLDYKEVIKNLSADAKEGVWQAHIVKIAKDISKLGAINLAAIAEYEQQLARKNYLAQQHDDLIDAITTLEAAIHKIDKESRQKFKATFDQVNQDLKKLFPKVFGGGSAYLDLTGDDLLETGVTIMARPPGKKNSTIHLLSGGEKALTALSLVFAIFRLNPAPFCMLDEVDAPLDDANVERFCNLVREMSQTVQFIYISHNKIAMEMASQLTGVTMFEAGVSRMVAVDIDEAVAMADNS